MNAHDPDAESAYVFSARTCPVCAQFLIRVHRRTRDRFISFFVPVQRYRCLGFSCTWEGNLREDHTTRSIPPADHQKATAKGAGLALHT